MLGLSQETSPIAELSVNMVVPTRTIPAVDASPGWHVLGEYPVPKTTPAKLFAVLVASASGLTVRVRLWDVTAKAELANAIASTSLLPEYAQGGEVDLVGGQRYQIQAECTGAAGDDKFATILSAGVT